MEGRELPVGWISEKLGNAVGLKTGPFGSSLHKSDYEDGATPVVNPMHIINGSIVPDLKTTVSENVLDRLREFRLQEGDVVLGRRGEMGRAAVVRGMESGWLCGTGSLILRQLGSIDPDYLQRFLSSPSVVMALEGASVGSTMVNLNQGILKSLEIPIAPLNEQRRIAAKLDTTLAAVEACRQRLDGVAELLKRFRQAVLAAATSGELTREWREERGMEKDWLGSCLSDIAEIQGGLTKDSKKQDPGDPELPYLRVANVQRGYLDLRQMAYIRVPRKRLDALLLQDGDILFNEGGDRDKVGRGWIWEGQIAECVFQNHVFRARLLNKSNHPKYVSWWANTCGVSHFLGQGKQTTNLASISKTTLGLLPIQLPCAAEQEEIVTRVETFFTLVDQLEARLATARKVVDRLTPALLAKAFRGELMPQDPGDEPASVLLDRIRAARQAEAGAGKTSRRGRLKAAANLAPVDRNAAPDPSEPLPPDLLTQLLRECGALSERALLAVSELEPERFEQQLFRELEKGTAREVQANGQVLLEAVA
jgi:type I restriction enzyme, S subunit